MGNKLLRISFFIFSLVYLFSSSIAPVLANTIYSYDADGNMTSDGTNCYTYNDGNQLTLVKNCSSGVTVAQYAYDYQGNRIVKKGYDASGNLQQTTYTPTKSYETKKIVAGNVTQNTAYYYVNDQLEARKNPDNSKNYYLADNLGSVSILMDANGAILENTTYYPFGNVRSGGTQSKQLYTGQINDPETSLYYYNARYYNSNIRRFTQPDTVIADTFNPQNLNRYSYVNNNPETYNDPTGNCPICIPLILGGIGLAAGLGAQYLSNAHSSWQDFAKAGGIGFGAGVLAPIVGEGATALTAGMLETTALSVGARTLIGRAVGSVAAAATANLVSDAVNGRDPGQMNIDVPSTGADMMASYLTDGIIPMQGRIPSLMNSSGIGVNSLKLISRSALSNVMGGVFEDMLSNVSGKNSAQYVYDYNTSNQTMMAPYSYNK